MKRNILDTYHADPIVRLLTVITTILYRVIIYGLFMHFLFHLRELFRRVRAGAPFDERNATSLRWLGLLLILIDTLGSAYRFGLALLVLGAMSPPPMPVTSSFSMDGTVIFVGLVLLALAEIFRRGAVLEDEHAHVV